MVLKISVLVVLAFEVIRGFEDCGPLCMSRMTPPWRRDQPNVIIFNADDLGWGDLASYGHPTQEWNFVDELASKGMRFTDFYSPSPICSPSRAGLLTGRIPERFGIRGVTRVFYHNHPTGLPKEEITIAEALKDEGYNTGFIGKWHLGINEHNHTDGGHLPHNHGFDYVGHNLPFSNLWECEEEGWHSDGKVPYPDPLFCYLYNGATLIQQPYSHYRLSEKFVNDAVDFMRNAKKEKRPFFLYYGLLQTHVNLYSGKGFRGTSRRGRYGDNVGEMAWSISAIMDEVKRLREQFNTITIFTSDNGPLLSVCNEGGDAGIFKGGKTNFFEGGVRVPAIFHWPGHIKPGSVSTAVASQLDLFPTLLKIAGGSIPDDRIMDGQDISSLLFSWYPEPQPEPVVKRHVYKEENSENIEPRLLVFFCNDRLYTVRYGSYKFHFTTQNEVLTKEEHHEVPGRCGEAGFPFQQSIPCVYCSQSRPWMPPDCTMEHYPPLMFNIDEDANEAYALNASLPRNQAVLDEMILKLDAFMVDMEFGPPLLDTFDRNGNVWPCCTPDTYPNCTCNYEYEGPDPTPGNTAEIPVDQLNNMIKKVTVNEYDKTD